ncbi:ABC-type branched-subunit amino acid transport system substrate-binding protein [Bradyrhizobium yuanmingense]
MKSLKLIGLAFGASLALSSAAFAQDVTVAVAGPMTGGESAFGRQMKNGAEMAVADINAAGGVNGKKLALNAEDDACDPKQARSIAEKIAGAKIPFVAGHFCSSSSIPASEAYADGATSCKSPRLRPTRSSPSASCGTWRESAAATTSRA